MEDNGGIFIGTYNILSEANNWNLKEGMSNYSDDYSLRNEDGIHYSMKGYQKVTSVVVNQINKRINL
jgi:hypothetical protein